VNNPKLYHYGIREMAIVILNTYIKVAIQHGDYITRSTAKKLTSKKSSSDLQLNYMSTFVKLSSSL